MVNCVSQYHQTWAETWYFPGFSIETGSQYVISYFCNTCKLQMQSSKQGIKLDWKIFESNTNT